MSFHFGNISLFCCHFRPDNKMVSTWNTSLW
jgi:hypothetical protein